jgi:hypothetical protein
MRFALLCASLGVWLLAMSACSSKDVAGCVEDDQCPGGNVCLDRKCEKLCGDDRDCTAGRYCDGTLCVVGARSSAPHIANIQGSGSNACVYATGGDCIGTHIVVSGSNLGGSEFLLGDGAGTSFEMVVPAGGRVQNDLVDLVPKDGADLSAGEFVLVVSNSAGEDQASVILLQGEPGDNADLTGDLIVERINNSTAVIDSDNVTGGGGAMTGNQIVTAINDSGTSDIISSERVAGGSGGGGATLYYFNNSTSATETGHSGDRMVVRVNASTTDVASLAVDQTRLEELCGDPDGCQISLGTIGWRFSGEPTWEVAAPYVNTPCRFFLNENAGAGSGDAWSLSSSCTQRYLVCNDWQMPCTSGESLYIAHYSGQFGSDGYTGSGDPPDDTLNVIHNRACYFSESPPDLGLGCACDVDNTCTGGCACDPNCACACNVDGSCSAGCVCDSECIYTRLTNDSSKGFTVFASHPDWAGPYWVGDNYWPAGDPDRACLLIVED